MIVAPEALSRFYVEAAGKDARGHARRRQLDDARGQAERHRGQRRISRCAVRARARALDGASLDFTALGFSQGVATVARWLERTDVHVDRAMLWGSTIPANVDLAAAPALRAARLTSIAGTADEHATPEMLAAQNARLTSNGFVRARELQRQPPHRSRDARRALPRAAARRTNAPESRTSHRPSTSSSSTSSSVISSSQAARRPCPSACAQCAAPARSANTRRRTCRTRSSRVSLGGSFAFHPAGSVNLSSWISVCGPHTFSA